LDDLDVKTMDEEDTTAIAALFSSLIKHKIKKHSSPGKPYEDYNIIGGIIETAKNLLNHVCEGSIKTLPYFTLNSPLDFFTSIILIISEPKAAGVIKNHGKFNSIFTGEYVVTGFKHTISQNDISSQFKVWRKPGIGEIVDDTDTLPARPFTSIVGACDIAADIAAEAYDEQDAIDLRSALAASNKEPAEGQVYTLQAGKAGNPEYGDPHYLEYLRLKRLGLYTGHVAAPEVTDEAFVQPLWKEKDLSSETGLTPGEPGVP